MIGMSVPKLQVMFLEAGRYLGLDLVLGELDLYRLSHSGPSADFSQARRRLDEIQARGRWVAAASMRRYQKGGRLNDLVSRCSMQTQAYATLCLMELPLILERRLAVPPPPPRVL